MNVDGDIEDERCKHAADTPAVPAGGVGAAFEAWARRTPDAAALVCSGGTLSYRELNERANRMAHRLIELGAGAGGRVGLRLPRSADFVVAMLAVLKTGAAYVPLEAGQSPARLARMVAENHIGLEVATAGQDTDLFAPGVRRVDPCEPAVMAGSPHDPGVIVLPDDVMYVPYTSGSTGTPKGAEVPHRAVEGFFRDETYAFWGPGAVTVHHSSLSWDGHVLDLYPALLSGGTVVIFEGDGDPVAVARTAAEHGATVLWLSAAAFNTVVDVDVHLLRGLQHLLIGGETLSPTHVSRALAALPGTRIVNGYGPSECTVFSTVHPIAAADPQDADGIPIGRAVGDRTVHLLDGLGRPVPDGVPGEVCVGGPGVAQGYLGRPALTAERFVPDPFSRRPGARMYRTGDRAALGADGLLRFGGRSDDQVKIRGFRVEPGEVTQLLRQHPAVLDAVVVPRRDARGQCLDLTAYAVLSGAGDAPSPDALREHLRQDLPPVMVPAAVVLLERMPLTPNGKVDKSALPAASQDSQTCETPYVPPQTDTERRLAAMWEELLDVRGVGRNHDFFRLGGQSLLATRMVARIRRIYGAELPLRTLYRGARLADVAAEIDRLRSGDARPPADVITRVARSARATHQGRSATR